MAKCIITSLMLIIMESLPSSERSRNEWTKFLQSLKGTNPSSYHKLRDVGRLCMRLGDPGWIPCPPTYKEESNEPNLSIPCSHPSLLPSEIQCYFSLPQDCRKVHTTQLRTCNSLFVTGKTLTENTHFLIGKRVWSGHIRNNWDVPEVRHRCHWKSFWNVSNFLRLNKSSRLDALVTSKFL